MDLSPHFAPVALPSNTTAGEPPVDRLEGRHRIALNSKAFPVSQLEIIPIVGPA